MYSHLSTHSSYTEHLGCCQFVCFGFATVDQLSEASHTYRFFLLLYFFPLDDVSPSFFGILKLLSTTVLLPSKTVKS